MSTSTLPASVSWDRLAPSTVERTLLQRITPVHMGVMLILVLVMLVVSSGPTAMRTPTVNRLPALASGGGSVDPNDPMLAPRAGTTALAAAASSGAAATPAKAAPKVTTLAARPAGVRLLRIGSATLNPRVLHGGIISPAAGTNLLVSGGGRATVGTTEHVQMSGIPSPAAGAKLAPQQLPYRPSDGVTMPRTGDQRDAHANEAHWAGTLPMQEPVAMPALTPGQAAQQAQSLATMQRLSSSAGYTPTADGPISAF